MGGVKQEEEEDGGKGRCVWGGVGWRGGLDDAANTRARWDRTPKQLRVTVITQAKLPSMVYVHVCVCVCVRVCARARGVSYIKLGRRVQRLDVRECEKETESE